MKTILILSANPKGTFSLELDREIRDIREAVDKQGSDYQVKSRVAVRRKDLESALLNKKSSDLLKLFSVRIFHLLTIACAIRLSYYH
ncbi:MAG: hypothetical protein QNJ41_13550 [Xenococcaceae cyanobacterium MO_188.B32]|nr:hypothetical protein [Xenococcaceae cyanobacterium MO_188.B32]